jgi:hypothetical protein
VCCRVATTWRRTYALRATDAATAEGDGMTTVAHKPDRELADLARGDAAAMEDAFETAWQLQRDAD